MKIKVLIQQLHDTMHPPAVSAWPLFFFPENWIFFYSWGLFAKSRAVCCQGSGAEQGQNAARRKFKKTFFSDQARGPKRGIKSNGIFFVQFYNVL